MPTFHDISKDSEEARQAMRALAHQTREIRAPGEMYYLLGTLNSTVRMLQQVLEQVANAHRGHADQAFTDAGEHVPGNAIAAAQDVRQAAAALEGVQTYLDRGQRLSGSIAWDPRRTTGQREAAPLKNPHRSAHGTDGHAPDSPPHRHHPTYGGPHL
jgi:hypothetical protein